MDELAKRSKMISDKLTALFDRAMASSNIETGFAEDALMYGEYALAFEIFCEKALLSDLDRAAFADDVKELATYMKMLDKDDVKNFLSR